MPGQEVVNQKQKWIPSEPIKMKPPKTKMSLLIGINTIKNGTGAKPTYEAPALRFPTHMNVSGKDVKNVKRIN